MSHLSQTRWIIDTEILKTQSLLLFCDGAHFSDCRFIHFVLCFVNAITSSEDHELAIVHT